MVNGLISGGSNQLRKLLENPNLQNAVPIYRNALTQVVQYNLETIEMITFINERCTIEPTRRSRLAIENARDTGYQCLMNQFADLQATNEYQQCIDNMVSTARTEIEALRPAINSCLQSLSTTSGPTNSI